jgi:trans-aconitate 2-methyltransferase
VTWDPGQYLKFADARARPFLDLMARVNPAGPVRSVVDLGCGPGTLTRTLAERWPDAHVLGLDNSPEMVAAARPLAVPGRLDFAEADVATWDPPDRFDVLVSNAVWQWVPGHDGLIRRLAARLAPGGVLAVQIPAHFAGPAHRAVAELADGPRWRDKLSGVGLREGAVHPLPWYVERLREAGLSVDAWETTYYHILTGADPVLEWMKGTQLRPILARLDNGERAEFLAELAGRYREAYPARHGETVFPFRRIFFVGTAAGRPGSGP